MMIGGVAAAAPFRGGTMLKKYRMPNGRTYQFEEKEAPKNAVLAEQKKVVPKNKARTTKNKAVNSK